jgi:hypothetical protein
MPSSNDLGVRAAEELPWATLAGDLEGQAWVPAVDDRTGGIVPVERSR